jgi:hypothetical protein
VPHARLTSLAAVSVAAGALAAPAAAGAHTHLSGGRTTLKLNPATAKVLKHNGVTVAPVKPARVAGGGIAFPITKGDVTLPTKGSITHRGGLRFSAGGSSLVVRNFVIRLGRSPHLTARAGGARVRLLDLSLKRAKISRSGVAYVVRGVKATLAGPAAKALNATFKTTLFKRGIPIGTTRTRAVPESLRLRGGTTTLALDPGATSALQSLGVTPGVIAPATAGAAGLAFPITRGTVNAKTLAGFVSHSGGITLTKGATVVRLERFRINVDSKPDLTAVLGGHRVSILDLDLSGSKTGVKGRRVTVTGVVARLTAGAAGALNQAFATTAFTAGLKLGTASTAARVR